MTQLDQTSACLQRAEKPCPPNVPSQRVAGKPFSFFFREVQAGFSVAERQLTCDRRTICDRPCAAFT